MRISYTPFLHAKEGEFIALSKVPPAERAVMLPLFDIGRFTPKMFDIKRYAKTGAPVRAFVDWVTSQIQKVGEGLPVMLDAFNWQPDETTECGQLPTAYGARRLLELGQPVVPVVGLDRWGHDAYRASLMALPKEQIGYWAIRLDTADIDEAAEPDELLGRLDEVLDGLGITRAQTGILLDFGNVFGKGATAISAPALKLLDLIGADGYRFYSVAGCSMPPSIDKAVKEHDAEGLLPRGEMLAWQAVRAARPLLPIVYGDYGVRGPTSLDFPVEHVNGKIRHTIDGAFFIARGNSIKAEDSTQMYRLARVVATSEHFQDAGYSWGDAELYKRATYKTGDKPHIKPGWTNQWIRFDTSHHLKHVLTEVTATEAALAAGFAVPELV